MKVTLCIALALVAVASAAPFEWQDTRRGPNDACSSSNGGFTPPGWCTATACKCAANDDCKATTTYCVAGSSAAVSNDGCADDKMDGATAITAACKCGKSGVTAPAAGIKTWVGGANPSPTAPQYCLLSKATASGAANTRASTDTCPSLAAVADKVLNTKATCGSAGDINGCTAGKVCIGGACLSACSDTDGAAVSGSDCACGVAKAAIGAACRLKSAVYYVTAKKKCSNVDGTTKVDADCTCGYKSGSTVDITFSSTADKFCFEGDNGKGFVTDAAQPACVKQDGSADSSVAACSCGTNDIIKVVQNKACKVSTAGVASELSTRCATTDGAAVSAACSCGINGAAVASGAACRVVGTVGYSTAKKKCSNVGTTKVDA